MTTDSKESGLKYAINILQDQCQSVMVYWLGFRPLNKQELVKLFPNTSEEELAGKLHNLQNLRVVNPIRDTADCYSLTDDGEQLRHLMVALSVWGAQQQDDIADRQSVHVVEPEANASLNDLVKYNETVKKYL